jgi:MbtH protein
MDGADSEQQFKVLINNEEQYSLWPARKKVPMGWQEAGFAGSREACMAYVDDVWKDMRPASLSRLSRQGPEVS